MKNKNIYLPPELNELQKKFHKEKMMSAFWMELLCNGTPFYNEEIDIKLQVYGLDLDITIPYLIVLFSVKMRELSYLRNEENLIRCIFRWENTSFFRISYEISGIVVPMERECRVEDVARQCDEYIRFLEDVWQYHVSVFVGTPLYMDKLTAHFNDLLEMEHEMVDGQPEIYMFDKHSHGAKLYERPNLKLLTTLIEQHLYDRAEEEVRRYFQQQESISRQGLTMFIQDFDRVIYYATERMGILLHSESVIDQVIYIRRYDSVECALRYVHDFMERLRLRVERLFGEKADAVAVVKQYIAGHLDQEIHRETLAEVVHLNADYLGRLFRKETGTALKDYILGEKMAMAKKLLMTTKLPVSEVALCTGFHNFGHFSTVFKRLVGMTPNQCRKQAEKNS